MKKLLASAAVVLGIAGFTTQSEAAPIPVELVLGIDSSGSISPGDFALQVGAYNNVLGSLLTTDGMIAIGIINFSDTVNRINIAGCNDGGLNMCIVNSAAKKTAVLNAITGLVHIGSTTQIAGTIDEAVRMLNSLSHADTNQIIDISTDGAQVGPGDPSVSAAAALSAGATTNCIGVGGSANCSFATGFSLQAANFAAFETALEQKIRQETGVPEPATLMLLGLGLAGVGFAARRRKAA